MTTERVDAVEKQAEKVVGDFAKLEARVAKGHSSSMEDVSLAESRILHSIKSCGSLNTMVKKTGLG